MSLAKLLIPEASPTQAEIKRLLCLGDTVHFVSEPKKLGKFHYALFIYTSKDKTYTDYAYCEVDGWKRVQDHPKYDLNHSFYGLPQGLIKIYKAEECQEAMKKYVP